MSSSNRQSIASIHSTIKHGHPQSCVIDACDQNTASIVDATIPSSSSKDDEDMMMLSDSSDEIETIAMQTIENIKRQDDNEQQTTTTNKVIKKKKSSISKKSNDIDENKNQLSKDTFQLPIGGKHHDFYDRDRKHAFECD